MNIRQKKKQFKKVHGENPPEVDGIMWGTPPDPDAEADPAAGNQKPESIY